MSETTTTLCSCCRKAELVSIPYISLSGEETSVEVCPGCDETSSWPNQNRKEDQ